jgi:hypothetical protein
MQLILPTDCLAVFVDDTGDELLRDPFQKVFGLSGCAVMASHLDIVVRHPWREVRRNIGGAPDAPLHATDIRHPTLEQLETIASFFQTQPFARFGAICSVTTDLDFDLSPMLVTAETLKHRIIEILRWQPFRPVEIIFEHSQRLASKIEAAFGDFNLEEDGNAIKVGVNAVNPDNPSCGTVAPGSGTIAQVGFCWTSLRSAQPTNLSARRTGSG